jgi:toxin ParE1/3/4
MAGEPGAVVKHPAALQDLVAIADFLGRDSLRVADRFLAMAEATFERLSRMPGIGEPFHVRDPRLAGVRRTPIARFRRYVVYYRPVAGGVEVLRVIHGARNIKDVLGPEATP